MNFTLKAELVRRWGCQSDAAIALGIAESRLSRILRGRIQPSDKERETFARVLGSAEIISLFADK